jgi:chemotaxis protein methyltransferase CheR
MKLARGEFEIMAKFIKEISGISLEQNKTYLIESRLSELAESEGVKTFSDFFFKAKFNKTLKEKIIDAISTNETSFFRDKTPFDAMKYKVIPDLIDSKTSGNIRGTIPSIKIWSAACSSGQEPYSIAMILMDMLPDIHNKWNITIVATDISDKIIRKASVGNFSDFELGRGLPGNFRDKYFINKNGSWHINDRVRSLVKFQKINLLEPFRGLGNFDIVFCRNVAIYFDPETKKKLFDRIAEVVTGNGYLFIGSTETLLGVSDKFISKNYLRAIFYQLK